MAVNSIRLLRTARLRKVHPRNPLSLNPQFAQEVFDSARHPKAWLAVAKRLKHSADAIFDREIVVAERFSNEVLRIAALDSETTPAEFDEVNFPSPNFDGAHMLMAFAIENQLKGLIIAKGQITFTKLELPKLLKTHDLRKLHGLAAPQASVPTYVLDVLTYMGEWRGRYPLPTLVENFWPMNDDGTIRGGMPGWSQFHSELFAYFGALEAELTNLA